MVGCKLCLSTAIEYQADTGTSVCTDCGNVIEENAIVAEVTFGETGSGAAMVQGSFVGAGSTRARMGNPFGKGTSVESREQTIENGRRKISQMAIHLRLSEAMQDKAQRFFTLALSTNFVRGRRSTHVIAVCLYVACRQSQTTHMLIDFSDALGINVFNLGRVYLDFIQHIHLQLPIIDPSHFISRFAAMLEFGDETNRVAHDAVRLVQRFNRDWIDRGRRPAGICGAALLLAARMNNFRRSVQEIIQVVKIADTTLLKRLEEFKQTPSSQLTVDDFRTITLESAFDPPAFYRPKILEERAAEKRKRDEEENDDDIEGEGEDSDTINSRPRKKKQKPNDNGEGKVKGKVTAKSNAEQDTDDSKTPLFLPDPDPEPAEQAAVMLGLSAANDQVSKFVRDATLARATSEPAPTRTPLDVTMDEEQDQRLAAEMNEVLDMDVTALEKRTELDAVDAEHVVAEVDELKGLDEDELDAYIEEPEHVAVKERIWVEMNRDYLEKLAGNMLKISVLKLQRKKGQPNKPRDSTNPASSSAAESTRQLVKQKISKRINYSALDNLFTTPKSRGSSVARSDASFNAPFRMSSTFEDKLDERYGDDKEDEGDADDYYQEDTNWLPPQNDDDKEDGQDDDYFAQEV
ncbi:BRF1-domain-containing protein [Auriculariales sp. MPI-PUGE-AT-0066]|nr:BRF1-domain-containing protein [Auriculariales sp. MPI-PUGE-AT-0066]